MVNHLMSNSAFSSVINQANNKNTSQINNTKEEPINQKSQSQPSSTARALTPQWASPRPRAL